MIAAFNELLSCIVTGGFTALFLMLLGKFGYLPMMIMLTEDELKELADNEIEEPLD